jgi:predicted phage terminase large subunit-like protein
MTRSTRPPDPSQLRNRHRQWLKTTAEGQLRRFIPQAWKIVEPENEFSTGPHIDAICEHLEAASRGQIRKLIINMPPRHMKSLSVSVFWFCWHWINHPASRWMFSSYSSDLSVRDSVKCRDIIQSKWYQENWGDKVRLMRDRMGSTKFENTKRGFRFATSTDSLATGEGGDFLVFDDPHPAKHVHYDTQREGVLTWYGGTMSSRGNDLRNVVRVVTMQRLHERDLTGFLLEQGGWTHLKLPAEYDPARSTVTSLGWKDWRTEPGELLWPNRIGHPELNELKSGMPAIEQSAQLQQEPSPPGGSYFKDAWFRTFTVEYHAEHPGEMQFATFVLRDAASGETRRYLASDCWIAQYADTAMKTGMDNDYTAVLTAIFTDDGRLLILDVFRDKIEVPNQFDALLNQRERHPYSLYTKIEDKASGTGLIQTFRMRGIPVRIGKGDADKVRRATPLMTLYQNGMVYHASQAAWLNDYETELLAFDRGNHDDQVDAAAYAAQDLVDRHARRPRIRDDAPPPAQEPHCEPQQGTEAVQAIMGPVPNIR